MVSYTSISFANEFIIRSLPDGISHLKLQKLVYSAYGWWLGGEKVDPILDDSPHAWSTGPVFPTLFAALKHFGSERIIDPQCGRFDVPPLVNKNDRMAHTLLDWVWERYGGCDEVTLASQCHRAGTPWDETYNHNNGSPGSEGRIIRQDLLRSYYNNLGTVYFYCFPENNIHTKLELLNPDAMPTHIHVN